jgi:hypothetical protein
MSALVDISADLRFRLEVPGQQAVTGTIIGNRSRLEIRLSDPAYFAGGRDAARLRAIASALAGVGVTVVVIAGDLVLLEVGITHTSWWQRRITGSANIKVASVRGILTGAAGRLRGTGSSPVLPGATLLPPATPWPLVPTMQGSTRRPTMTHDPRRGGYPRLALTIGNKQVPQDGAVAFPLRGVETTIGSDAACDIRLAGLDPVHAVVVHDESDEFILMDRSRSGTTLLNGAAVGSGILRTGARISLGDWSLAYPRPPYPPHGSPYRGTPITVARTEDESAARLATSAPNRTLGATTHLVFRTSRNGLVAR